MLFVWKYIVLGVQIFQAILILILGVDMNLGTEQVEEENKIIDQGSHPKLFCPSPSPHITHNSNPHLAFQKNYPKNIFIPIIEHLSERGLQKHYEECVGTRQGFEGKNVVSLAEIHRVMSQEWFSEGINLLGLMCSMSNKILMNSKIKKKLFHLLLIRELFTIPLHDPREFKKMVSKKANEVSDSNLPNDELFNFPSGLIYLLHIFAQGLAPSSFSVGQEQDRSEGDEEGSVRGSENSKWQGKSRKGETSSKLQYKLYISKIISYLNGFEGDSSEFLDLIQSIKGKIQLRQSQIRQKYRLPQYVPQWSYFNSIVVNNCYLMKRNKHRLTYSLLNTWIQEFKQKATTLKGFIEIVNIQETRQVEHQSKFKPIILIYPP